MIFGQFGHEFALVRIVLIIIFLVWLGIGIQQWFVIPKWTKYEHYKELQRLTKNLIMRMMKLIMIINNNNVK